MAAASHSNVRVPAIQTLVGVLLALAAGACSDPRPEPIRRLFDELDRAVLEARADQRERQPYARFGPTPLAPQDASADAAAGWHWIGLDFTATEGTPPTPREARILESGGLALADRRGAWVRGFELGHGETGRPEPLVFSARVSTTNMPPGPGVKSASIAVAELSTLPEEWTAPALAASILRVHWSPAALDETEGRLLSVLVEPSAECRALAFLGALNLEPDLPGAEARFEALTLEEACAADFLAAATGDASSLGEPDRAGGARRAVLVDASIAATHRPGTFLLPGEALVFPVGPARTPTSFETFAGLLAHELLPEGVAVEFVVEARRPGADPLELARETLVSASPKESRWRRLAGPLPTALHAEPFELALRVAPAEGRCAPVFAAPRLVPDAPARPGPNVLLVSLDTLRADHMGTYGYGRDSTPAIDAFAREALVFEAAWANAPYTLPSHVSLLSGQLPSVHAVQRPGARPDPARTPWLAELLAARGWSTAAFTGGGFVHPTFGFARGFDRYSTSDPVVNLESPKIRANLERMPVLSVALTQEIQMEAVGRWIEEHAAEPFFLFVHTYAPHQFDPPLAELEALGLEPRPYTGDERSRAVLAEQVVPTEPDLERVRALYDGAIRFTDEAFGRLMEALDRAGLKDETLVVLTSDHGKEFYEHGHVNHGHSLYEELLHVPLLLRFPGLEAGRDPRPVMLVDVLPTLLDALDLPAPDGLQGASLLGPLPERAVWAEVENLAVKYALRRGDQKTIWSPLDAEAHFRNERELERFDLTRDPDERSTADADSAGARELRTFRDDLRALSDALSDALSGGERAGSALDEATLLRLQELGYTIGLED